MRTISTTPTTTSFAPTVTPSLTTAHRSSWHSPVPYLFGGLAAMLGLIAFALLILACSYWKLAGQLQNEDNDHRELESHKQGGDSANKVYEEKILVIMAGDDNPTFLATPAYPKSSSFAHGVGNHFDKNLPNHEPCEKSDKETENHLQSTIPQSQQSQCQ